MNLRARFCLMGSALALSLIGSAAVCHGQSTTTTTWVWTPYDHDAARVRALQAINDADLSKQDIASVIGLLRDLRDAETSYMLSTGITANDLMAHSGTQFASHETRVDTARRAYLDRRDSIWKTIHERLGDPKANAIHNLVEFRGTHPTTAYYTTDRIRRMDEVFTWWDNRNSGQTVVATTTVTTEPGRAHRDLSTTVVGVAPLTTREMVDLMEAKLIAMTGSHEAAWILQGMYGDVQSDDIKFAREQMLRVWDWQ